MSEQPPSDEAPAPSQTTPGEVPPRRRLERAPSERFGGRPGSALADPDRVPPGSPAGLRRGYPLALAIAAVGAVAVVVLYGVVATTFGLLAIAGTTGFLVGAALRGRPQSSEAGAAIAVGAMVIAIFGSWAVSIAAGGVVGPVDYVGQTLGALALLVPIAGGIGAWLGSR